MALYTLGVENADIKMDKVFQENIRLQSVVWRNHKACFDIIHCSAGQNGCASGTRFYRR